MDSSFLTNILNNWWYIIPSTSAFSLSLVYSDIHQQIRSLRTNVPILRGETVFVKLVKVSSFSAFHTTFYFCFYDISWFLTGAVSSASLRAWANFTHIIKTELHYVLCEKMSGGEKISGDGKRTNSFRVCPRPPQPLELETKVFKEKAPTLLGPSLSSHERHYVC